MRRFLPFCLLIVLLLGCSACKNDTVDTASFSVDGVSITSFRVYNNSLIPPEELSTTLYEAFGMDFPCDPEMSYDPHYIIFDGSELLVDKYTITVEHGNIVIKGSARSLPAAVEYFFETYLWDICARDGNMTAEDIYTGSIGKASIYTKEQLAAVLQQVYDNPDQIIIGGQLNGSTQPTVIRDFIDEFTLATGEVPGIIGIDLGCYGIDLMETDDVLWSAYICDIVDYCAKGGIVTVSAHWENPSGNTMDDARCRGHLGYGTTKEEFEQGFTDLITEGTEYNTFFKNELSVNARFLKALEANGIPVIWRPLHETNGDWFWFCTVQANNITLSPSYLVNVWCYVHDYFTKDWDLQNLIWNYSPNYSSNINNEPYAPVSTVYLYPGDDYCDMVGVDWYSEGDLEITDGDSYLRLTERSGKPGAITEFGPTGSVLADSPKNQPDLYHSMDLHDDLIALTENGYSFSYLLTWNGAWSIPSMGRGNEFMDTDLTLGQAEVSVMLASVK